ncbi:hypothetical protein Gasu2_14340 [Galdieria sulphuraria]|nr:hypothetical protein Gasu2_14340 [Galdieria sulphuraria]
MASLDEKWKAVDNFKSVVVDRERDVVRVTKELYDLHSNREQLRVVTSSNNYRLTIPFAPHMFGSGKTTFYVTYLELENLSGEAEKGFVALHRPKAAKAHSPHRRKKRNLEWAVYYLLIKVACLQSGLPQPDPDECFKELKLRTDAVVQKFRSILNIPSDQYLLIAFDEVGVLDESLDEFHFKRTHGGRVRPYNDFIGIIRELCKEPDLFFIVVGKSEGLNIYNYYRGTFGEKFFFFYSLGAQRFQKILCHEDFSTSELAELLLELTGGVPGLLVRAISYLLLYKSSNNNFLLSKETFLIIMNSFLVTNYCVATFLPRLISLSEQRKRLLRMLTLLSLYRIRFDFDETVQISSNSDVFLFDLVTDMCLYRRLVIEPDRNERYEVLIPKLLIEYIDQGLKDDRLEWLLLQTLKSQSVDFFYESKCRILEGLIATLFYLHFSRHPTNSSMFSTLGQLSRVWNEMNLQFSSESAAYYMKSIHYTRAVSGTERMTFGSNDEWERIVEEILEFEKIYIPFHSTFHSPDILFKLHGRTNEKNLMIVGIACKGRWSRNGIRWNEILEEAHKFLKPVHDQVLISHPTWHCMLIIMSTQLATNVSEDLNYSSRCYSSGDSVEDFVIPHNCELVILSEADVENFIGKDILSNLRNAFKSVDNPHSRNIGISTLQEIVSSLSKKNI